MGRARETLNHSLNAPRCASTHMALAPPIQSQRGAPSMGRGGMRRLSGKCHEALVLLAQALDRKPHAVAGFEELRRLHAEADIRGSARRDDVARQQRHEMTDIADDLVDPEDQGRGTALLYPLTVYLRPY